jgi:hypothetical protein
MSSERSGPVALISTNVPSSGRQRRTVVAADVRKLGFPRQEGMK